MEQVWFITSETGTDLIVSFAVRKGDYKSHYLTRTGYGGDQVERRDPPLLFNLAEDPSERFDVASKHPDILADIDRELARHRTGLKPPKSQLDDLIK